VVRERRIAVLQSRSLLSRPPRRPGYLCCATRKSANSPNPNRSPTRGVSRLLRISVNCSNTSNSCCWISSVYRPVTCSRPTPPLPPPKRRRNLRARSNNNSSNSSNNNSSSNNNNRSFCSAASKSYRSASSNYSSSRPSRWLARAPARPRVHKPRRSTRSRSRGPSALIHNYRDRHDHHFRNLNRLHRPHARCLPRRRYNPPRRHKRRLLLRDNKPLKSPPNDDPSRSYSLTRPIARSPYPRHLSHARPLNLLHPSNATEPCLARCPPSRWTLLTRRRPRLKPSRPSLKPTRLRVASLPLHSPSCAKRSLPRCLSQDKLKSLIRS